MQQPSHAVPEPEPDLTRLSPEKGLLPRLQLTTPQLTPRRKATVNDVERLTSSAVRGVVASELLSLARGSR